MRLTLVDVVDATGGELIAGDTAGFVDSVSVDTRSLTPGALFVALRGTRDGHDFVAEAFARGAAAAVVDRPVPEPEPPGPGVVLVADTAVALTDLGRAARRRLADIPVVGITGSTGKTSTKDLAAAALGARRRVCASVASFNNEIGVPLTLLSAGEATEVVVAEMGSRGMGHIAALAEIAQPVIGVVTNIGMAHAEMFGSREEIAWAKGELVEALPPGGHAVLGADCDMTPVIAPRSPAPVLSVGLAAHSDVRVSQVTLDSDLRPSFRLDSPWGSTSVEALPLRGIHQATNAAFAIAVAGLLGVSPDEAAGGLSGAVGSPWRMELRRTGAGLVVLNDAYNANPTSMAAALEAIRGLNLNGAGRRYAVLGHMAELGTHAEEEHRRIGRLAAGCDLVVGVGPEAAPIVEAAREAGVDAELAATTEEALAVLSPRLRAGDAVLVKASRVAGLERVAAALETWTAEHS